MAAGILIIFAALGIVGAQDTANVTSATSSTPGNATTPSGPPITCHVCAWRAENHVFTGQTPCRDPFTGDFATECPGGVLYCAKLVMKFEDSQERPVESVVRACGTSEFCATSGSNTVEAEGFPGNTQGVHCCTGDKCNGGVKPKGTAIVFLVLFSLFAILFTKH